jgi:hypothetical protein
MPFGISILSVPRQQRLCVLPIRGLFVQRRHAGLHGLIPRPATGAL